MNALSMFWGAFFTGMAAPVSLYAAQPSYSNFTTVIGPAESFAIVGGYLSEAAKKADEEAKSRSK